jgi:GAF domain-containing protein
MAQKRAVALQSYPQAPTPPHSALVAPVALRGAVIGALGIHDDAARQWTEEELALINAVAERMALAADNLRLLDETQRRAAHE